MDDDVDDEYSYQRYDFDGASGFSFGGVKATYDENGDDDEDDGKDRAIQNTIHK